MEEVSISSFMSVLISDFVQNLTNFFDSRCYFSVNISDTYNSLQEIHHTRVLLVLVRNAYSKRAQKKHSPQSQWRQNHGTFW